MVQKANYEHFESHYWYRKGIGNVRQYKWAIGLIFDGRRVFVESEGKRMLLDGYWKRELKREAKRLRFWSSCLPNYLGNPIEHKVNRSLLYSAVIIRKIFEDEKDAEPFFKEPKPLHPAMVEEMPDYVYESPLKTLTYTVPMKQAPFKGDPEMLMQSRVWPEDYDDKHLKTIKLPLNQVCNQIIHSYVWGVVPGSKKQSASVLFASDKKKEELLYWMTIEDWLAAIVYVADHCAVNSI